MVRGSGLARLVGVPLGAGRLLLPTAARGNRRRPEHAAGRHGHRERHLRPAHADLLDLRDHRRRVFGAIFWSVIHHRKSAGAEPAHFHESTRLEIAWTIVPTLILIGMAWPATSP
jgi:hypothetical protein